MKELAISVDELKSLSSTEQRELIRKKVTELLGRETNIPMSQIEKGVQDAMAMSEAFSDAKKVLNEAKSCGNDGDLLVSPKTLIGLMDAADMAMNKAKEGLGVIVKQRGIMDLHEARFDIITDAIDHLKRIVLRTGNRDDAKSAVAYLDEVTKQLKNLDELHDSPCPKHGENCPGKEDEDTDPRPAQDGLQGSVASQADALRGMPGFRNIREPN